MSRLNLADRAALAALFQRQHGDMRSLRDLYCRSFSLLRYIHHRWEAVTGEGG